MDNHCKNQVYSHHCYNKRDCIEECDHAPHECVYCNGSSIKGLYQLLGNILFRLKQLEEK